MSVRVVGDDWACSCGAEGINGEAGLIRHSNVMHGPKQLYPLHPSDDVDGIPACEPLTPRRGRGSVVPDGIDSKQVRAWARVNGWPMLGDRGRLPQDAIDQYLQVHA